MPTGPEMSAAVPSPSALPAVALPMTVVVTMVFRSVRKTLCPAYCVMKRPLSPPLSSSSTSSGPVVPLSSVATPDATPGADSATARTRVSSGTSSLLAAAS